MPPFKCTKGCKTKRGVPAWHSKKADCPYEAPPEAVPTPPMPEGTGTTEEIPVSTTTTTTPAPPVNQEGSALTFKDRIANTLAKKASNTTLAKPIEDMNWTLPKENVVKFFDVIFRFGEQILNMFNRYMGMAALPPDMMRINASDKILIGDMMQAPVTKFTKGLGFKTLESAVRWIDTLTGLSIFGLMVGNLILFYATNLPKAPKFVKWQERKKAAKKQAEEKKIQALSGGTNGAVPGVPAGA